MWLSAIGPRAQVGWSGSVAPCCLPIIWSSVGRSLGSFWAGKIWSEVTWEIYGIVIELMFLTSETLPYTFKRLVKEKAL